MPSCRDQGSERQPREHKRSTEVSDDRHDAVCTLCHRELSDLTLVHLFSSSSLFIFSSPAKASHLKRSARCASMNLFARLRKSNKICWSRRSASTAAWWAWPKPCRYRGSRKQEQIYLISRVFAYISSITIPFFQANIPFALHSWSVTAD